MNRRILISFFMALVAAAHAAAFASGPSLKIGMIMPMSGLHGLSGEQVVAGARLYMQEHGDIIAGKKVELVVRDDAGSAETAKRLANELVLNDKVNVLAGFGLTPMALSVAPVATKSKTPMVVMVAATSKVIDASPYIVRSSFTMPQTVAGIAKWAPKNGIKTIVTLVADYAPGLETEAAVIKSFTESGGKVVESLRIPLNNPDFAPILQKVIDRKPDAVFAFFNPAYAVTAMKQMEERGLRKAGIKVIGLGDMVADDVINNMGDVALGVYTSHHYSAAHPSEFNTAFVKAYGKANAGKRPNFMSVAGYDGMHIIYEALKRTEGKGDGDAVLNAMKGLRFESPRGPVTIDPATRDITQNVYLRKVERVRGELWNTELETLPNVKASGEK